MLKKRLKTLKVVVSIIVLDLLLTCKAAFASFTLNIRNHIVYSIIGTLCKIALGNFKRLKLYFL